jgi:hypothetical protein
MQPKMFYLPLCFSYMEIKVQEDLMWQEAKKKKEG